MGRTPGSRSELRTSRSWSSFSIFRVLPWTRGKSVDRNRQDDNSNVRNRLGKCLYPVIALLFISPAAASQEPVPVTAIANPQATSSGSVTNSAVQVLNGPYITNTFGGGVQCQSPTLTITPFITTSQTGQGAPNTYSPDNSWTFNPGLSATISVPLSTSSGNLCQQAATAHTRRVQAETAKAQLDFELVRLLRCGEAVRAGIYFHPDSPYAAICADVVVANAPQVVSSSQPSSPPLVVLPPISAPAPSPQVQSTTEARSQ